MSEPLHKKNPLHLMHSGVHIARHSGRLLSAPIRARMAKQGLKHRIHDAIILILAAALIGIGAWNVIEADPGKRVTFTAVVAPEAVVSGDSSTLSIGYTNNSRHTLKDVTLTLEYPPFFHLEEVEDETFEPQTNTLPIGDLAPGANGLVKIRGVMFGDVGGGQTFRSTLSYGWKEDHTGVQERSYTFSPATSALEITTQLPDQLVSGQRIAGEVLLRNTGPVTFPEAAIHARFPEGFRLAETSLRQREDETWIVPSLEPEEELLITYAGALDLETGEEALFSFEPSFVFGSERFVQDTLTETVATVPPPINVTLDVPEQLAAGRSNEIIVRWSDQSDLSIVDPVIRIEGATTTPEIRLDTPVVGGERTFTLTPRSGSGTERSATYTPVVTFQTDESGGDVTVQGASTTRKLTTSASLSGFARYFSSAGDQLGRGPLPPRVGEPTTYWIFLNLRGTFNDLSYPTITATLPANATWVDKQSVTMGSGVQYDPATRRITWALESLPATVTSGRTAAASFAVSIVPNASQVGSTGALLTNVRLQATDTWTNQSISRTLPPITTAIEEDAGRIR